jgi:hypothetical protein
MALPATAESTSYGNASVEVRGKTFVWERPLGKKDVAALGDAAPDGPVLAAHVADVGVRDALIADEPDVFFTTPHFAGYPAVLLRLDRIPAQELAEVVVDAWRARAPARLVAAHDAADPPR